MYHSYHNEHRAHQAADLLCERGLNPVDVNTQDPNILERIEILAAKNQLDHEHLWLLKNEPRPVFKRKGHIYNAYQWLIKAPHQLWPVIVPIVFTTVIFTFLFIIFIGGMLLTEWATSHTSVQNKTAFTINTNGAVMDRPILNESKEPSQQSAQRSRSTLR